MYAASIRADPLISAAVRRLWAEPFAAENAYSHHSAMSTLTDGAVSDDSRKLSGKVARVILCVTNVSGDESDSDLVEIMIFKLRKQFELSVEWMLLAQKIHISRIPDLIIMKKVDAVIFEASVHLGNPLLRNNWNWMPRSSCRAVRLPETQAMWSQASYNAMRQMCASAKMLRLEIHPDWRTRLEAWERWVNWDMCDK